MKKLVLMTLALAMLMISSVFATDTRVLTMGDNNMVLIDEANMWMFPSRTFDYPNVAIGEFYDDGDFYNFGINWKFGDDNPWVLGTYISQNTWLEPEDHWGSDLVGWDELDEIPNKKIDLLYARMLGENKFGFGLSFANSSWSDDDGTDKEEESFTQFGLSFGLTPKNDQWDVSAMFQFGSWTDNFADGSTDTEADGYYDVALMGRYFMNSGPNYTWIPHAAVMTGKHGVKWNDGDDQYGTKMTGFNLGLGLNYTPANNVLAVFDFGLHYMKIKEYDETEEYYEYSDMSIPYFKIGMDADVFKWLDVRFGGVTYWYSEKDKFDTDEEKWAGAWNELYLGFGMHFGRLHIDTYADPEIFTDGFYFLSGESEDMNYQLSVLYEMF
jgi:hypothetical protein